MLQAQVNPHFLFNALNTISAVIRRDPDKARELIQHLSQFFRRNLKHNIESVTIQEELDHINAYLEIELARFSDRLMVNIKVDSQLLTQTMPTFTLQPLVENAIKHGTSTLLENGVIDVMGYLEDGIVILKVIDNAGTYCLNDQDCLNKQTSQSGLGLQIVDKRLKNCFGESYGLTMLCDAGISTISEIKFPYNNVKSSEKNGC